MELARSSSLSRGPAFCSYSRYRNELDGSSGAGIQQVMLQYKAEHRLDSPDNAFNAQLYAVIPKSPPSPIPQFRPTNSESPQGYQQFGWLQNMTITLLIDQEGFRTVRPVLKLTSIARRQLRAEESAETDIVTFKPATEQTFRFHYAPFDGLPVLRRLTMNEDDTRDYLSRQAYLSLKCTGVYRVHGTELAVSTPVASAPPGESTKLFWKFEYLVEDRRAERSGKILDGEKILVPLTFSCSPRLLHPSQGRKVKIMHIVKKAVATKLMAEKIRPLSGKLGSVLSVLPTPSWKTDMQTAAQLYLAKSQAWHSHRRAQSNPREAPETTYRGPSPSPHRRRASSAGESEVKINTNETTSPTRRIIPPSRLRQLLEQDYDEQTQPPINGPASEFPLGFFPLKPSPWLRD